MDLKSLHNNKFFGFFTSPFCANMPYLLMLCLLLSIGNIYGWTKLNMPKYTMYFTAWNFLVSYVLLLPLPLLKPSWLRRTYLILLFAFAAITAAIDYFFWFILQGTEYFQVPEIVRNTNGDEIRDFFSHNLNMSLLLPMIGGAVILVALYALLRRLAAKAGIYTRAAGVVIVLGCVLLCVHYPYAKTDSVIGKIKYWHGAFTREVPDLKDYYHDVTVEAPTELPHDLVIIIGESFSRHHSSLYGYDKPTNPRLSAYDSDNLYIYSDVESADLYTLGSFKKFMNDSKGSDDQREWYECLTLQELLSKAGYHSKWISNQNRIGLCDNDLTAFATITDEQYFVRDKALRVQTETYDGEIIPLVEQAIQDSSHSDKNLYWIHLMGSHNSFDNRYPKDYGRFTPADYPTCPESQRKLLSEYDNSILYNDFVIDSILSMFADKPAMVIYFADHGFDVFYTDPDYCNYGRNSDPASAKLASQIPFMVYLSDSLRMSQPELVTKVQQSQAQYLNTNELLDFVTDLLQLQYAY